MLTKNFYQILKTLALRLGTVTLTNPSGTTATTKAAISVSSYPLFTYMNRAYANNYGVRFGTDATPESLNAFTLNAPIDEGISVVAPSATTVNEADAYIEFVATYGVTNSAENEITISEIGLYTEIDYASSSSSSSIYSLDTLVDRTVLDTPVTIPAGQSKQITYTIRFNY